MTVVVADTSPLNYLLLIGEIEILPALYGNLVIPTEVFAELTDSDSPREVSRWMRSKPDWLHVQSAEKAQGDPELRELDPGERAAILLAAHEPHVLLLIDDAAGRAAAQHLGIPTTGTLGVLRAAAIRNLVDFPAALELLAKTNFRISATLFAELLSENDRSRRRDGAMSALPAAPNNVDRELGGRAS